MISTENEQILGTNNEWRWEVYGAPSTPSPTLKELNKHLTRWTNESEVQGAVFKKDSEYTTGITQSEKIPRKRATAIWNQVEKENEEIPTLPMLQNEVNETLKER